MNYSDQESDRTPTLYVFAGLPGVGKTSLSQRLARMFKAVHLRIDTIEQALRDLCGMGAVQGEGYELAYRLAADNLRLGVSVIADSCNPIALTRDEWDGVARKCEAKRVNIEVICSDRIVHRRRVESRVSTIAGLMVPTWEDVEHREYDAWAGERVVVDTCGKTEETSFGELLAMLAAREGTTHGTADGAD